MVEIIFSREELAEELEKMEAYLLASNWTEHESNLETLPDGRMKLTYSGTGNRSENKDKGMSK